MLAKIGPRHYHMHASSGGGYSPYDSSIATNLREARQWTKDKADQWREDLAMGPSDDPRRVTGNLRDGYTFIDPKDPHDLGSYTSISDPCHCDEVWRCSNGTYLGVDEDRCWCCGEKPPAAD